MALAPTLASPLAGTTMGTGGWRWQYGAAVCRFDDTPRPYRLESARSRSGPVWRKRDGLGPSPGWSSKLRVIGVAGFFTRETEKHPWTLVHLTAMDGHRLAPPSTNEKHPK